MYCGFAPAYTEIPFNHLLNSKGNSETIRNLLIKKGGMGVYIFADTVSPVNRNRKFLKKCTCLYLSNYTYEN